ncbi:Protein farnesyltransferase/geranylgeranyltransferase type-1 subunit alpha [Orchesella cincta]|uniref:Protein farnesyltransferase/geranylgeranyltransferase type-1 subunit alpha n=1 Tax=Orchesella cincta TaxID=48709 RepID=A0A1D2M5V1_ORCCI|nr:Protein farnesyltransferase/geranylgeranyltransferase type-1 subunit alpha [Orchesella cincta]
MLMLATEMGISGENGGSGDEVESLKGQGFYKDKPEWKDVIPIDSVDGDDGDEPVVSIAYSEKFKDVFSYVWAVKSSGELSPRVLDLTRDAIKLDAANYTVWQLRRDALQALKIPHLATEAGLGPDFEKEFELNSEILKHHPKNYQPWQHEKALLSWAIGYQEEVGLDQIQVTNAKILEPILERELKLTERMLGADPKNYHAWQHRQWVLGVFKGCFPSLAGEELAFVKTLLENDARNNSAWNQRYFVFLDLFGNFSVKAVAKEVAQTWEFVKADAGNEQAWSHLLSILNLVDPNFQISDQKKVVIEAKDHGSIVFIPYSPLTMLLTCLLIVGAVNDLPDAELSPEEEVRDHLRRPNNGNCAIGEISRLLFSAGDPVLLPNNFGVLEWKMLCPVGCGSILSLADRNMASLRNHMVRPACAQSPNRRTTWRDHIISKLMDYQIRYLYAEYEAFRLAPDFAWMQDYRSEEEEMLLILRCHERSRVRSVSRNVETSLLSSQVFHSPPNFVAATTSAGTTSSPLQISFSSY